MRTTFERIFNTRHAIEIWSINTIYSPSPWEHKAIVHRYYLPSCITARSAFLFDNLLRITSTKNYSKIYMSNGHSDSLLMILSKNYPQNFWAFEITRNFQIEINYTSVVLFYSCIIIIFLSKYSIDKL